ncbi:efflux RND transporter periplasmic adaptor subunit [Pseudothauera rhizosphaerae]|uniref:Efflux RND transporter periplasmic adaptor subunit n=1 Tax=Pseudothauera rhizosphaerae TaxID=2565932 RepID=A0A4S4AF43_9RHOO|nr:efflux RND transporter periplasmic adaptor subunit [Pseudothauera rhizosphaerae]THF56874.1 efflux RND transporter periplasmic adaptor subunit [Pseudothauera rhizosphaerae]
MNSPARPASRPRRFPYLILVPLGVLIAGAAFVAWQYAGSRQSPADLYQFVNVQRADIEDVVTATGTLQPRDYVDVGAQVSGQLKKFHVEVGSEVKAGDLLAEIDATVLQSKVDATRAQLRNLRATLGARESDLALAEIQYRRQQNLIAEEATTEEAVQQAEASLRSARAQIEALRAQIDQTESNLRADEANLQYTRIEAPIAGTVVSISARLGQTLNSTQQAPVILRVADLTTMTVQTQVSEADVSRLRPGMDAYFTTLGAQGKRWYGKLAKVEPTPTVTNNVVLYNALFDVPNSSGELMTQMTAQVYFVVAQARDVLQVPVGALSMIRAAQRPQGAEAGAGAGAAAAERRAMRVQSGGNGEGRGMEGGFGGPNGERRGPRAQPGGESGGPGEAGERRANRTPREGGGPREGAQAAAGAARQATVRVLGADDTIEERTIAIGVSNRVAAQVLSGLEEGEKVVAGLASGAQASGNRPPMMGPGPRL